MNLALRSFVESNGAEIVSKGLYRNFVLHCCNLHEFGVVGPAYVFLAVTRLQQFMKDGQGASSSSWDAHRQAWMRRNSISTAQPRKDFSGIFKKEPEDAADTNKKAAASSTSSSK